MTPGSFKLLDHHGNIIASGASSHDAMAPLPDSAARKAMLAEWAQYKADAAEAKLQQERAQEAQARAFCDGVARLDHRIGAEERKRAKEARRKAKEDAEREKKANQAKLDAQPDPDDPASWEGGELTTHPPSHPGDTQQLRAITAGGKDDADNEGDLPLDLTRSVPPTPGNYAWPPLDEPAKQPQPISVQLNSEV
jgi:hypothetical protein